jgi:molybdopterin synthase catalytic subunit
MAAAEMERIANEIEAESPDVIVAALHRTGLLEVSETAVVCAASAPHRREAFHACRKLIDSIKARVPIWKREHGPDGPYWVGWEDARCLDEHHDDDPESEDHTAPTTLPVDEDPDTDMDL